VGATGLVIDADGHVEEDITQLVRAVPDSLRSAASDLIPKAPGEPRSIEGRPWVMPFVFPYGENNHTSAGGVRQEGGRDPKVRIEVLDNEGIDIAVLFTSSGQLFFLFDRADVADALCRAYNDWLAEYCAHQPDRLVGVALLPQQDPEMAAAELERAVTAYGFVGGIIRPNRVSGRTVEDPAFDVLWQTAVSLDVPIAFHEAYIHGIDTIGQDRMPCYAACHISSHVFEQMTAMLVTTVMGIPDRFPGLRLGFMEAGCGWAPTWLDRIEEHYEFAPDDFLGGDPHGLVNKRSWLTFEVGEPGLEETCRQGWADNICFASDYPHFDAAYPGVVKRVRDRGLGTDLEEKLLASNAIAFYGSRLGEIAARRRRNQS
jgi:predicted TIM-barrel fold metal-dependent hydrolase